MKLSNIRIEGEKSDKHLSEIENINCNNAWEEVIKFYIGYFRITHNAGYEAKHDKGLKILTPKQCFRD